MDVSILEKDIVSHLDQVTLKENSVDVELIIKNTTKNQNIIIQKLSNATKRVIDIIGSIFGIIALLPLTIGIYIANLICKENGPVFYSQERIGKDGKLFKMYKYRTMVVGADEKLEKYLKESKEAQEEYRKYKKLKKDPRITKIGRFLRKTSLDEFPQFINVLKGEMSLVGPRPYLPREKEEMGIYYKYIIQCKPGVTGFWQVNGRSNVTFQDRLDMDLKYIIKKSLKQDFILLKKTIVKVIRSEGVL